MAEYLKRVYECDHCKLLHKSDSDKFFRFIGLLYVGHDGGVVGPEPTEMTFCRKEPCNEYIVKAMYE